MQIILVQAEIDAAIRSHLCRRFNIEPDTAMAIELAATRGSDGFRATIDIAHEDLFPSTRLQPCIPVSAPVETPSAPALSAAAPEPAPVPETPPAAEPETPSAAAPATKPAAAPTRTPKIFARPQLVTPAAPAAPEVGEEAIAGDPPFEGGTTVAAEAGEVVAEPAAAPAEGERRSLFRGLKRPQGT
ncbi:hypothetical protein [Roseococcus sp.]|uniref:hypothetical protein n=1 Tax=Roseococcus sp. TaxID=2109646 RepID=UPI003BAA2681